MPELLSARYQLNGLVGRGDMTEVFRAYDISLDRIVAIKRLREDLAPDQTFQARFHREAQSVASLNHPSIIAVYDTGEDMVGPISVPYVVMEYVDGRTLRDLLSDGRRLLPARALEIVDGILRALDYSHRNDIVHRDIKPANVMLTRTGDVKMMDFGITRALSDSQVTMTQTSQVIGTAQYLSPEQARGERVDTRSDLYSTGCLLYELFTGQPPFSGDSPVAIAYQHVRENPVPPSQVDPEIPRWADDIVLKAMAKNPADRYQNAAEMRTDIQRTMSRMPVSVPPNPPSPSADHSQPDAQQPREPVERPAPPEAWQVSMHQHAARPEAWQGSIGNIRSSDLNRAYHATITDHSGFLLPRKRRARKNLQRAREIQDRGSWKGTAGSFRDRYIEDAKRGVEVARHTYRVLMRLYWSLRALVIVAGISVAAVAATNAPRWSLALLGALAAGAETAIAASNLQQRAVVSGDLAEHMARELRDFSGRFGSYAAGDALETLHDRIEWTRSEASTARFRLDRASDQARSAATGRRQ